MKARLLILLVALVPAAFAQSNSWPAPSLFAHDLADAKIFALGPVGFALETSEEERLFKAMMALDREKAEMKLERLYSSGNPQAMGYALVGMRKLDPSRYAELLSAARASDVRVTTGSGCIIGNPKLRQLANDLDSGKFDPLLHWMSPQ